MTTRLAPTCDDCGAKAKGGGYVLDPGTLKAVCLSCAIPDESERERVMTEAVRDLMRRCEQDLGRRPESVREFMRWIEDQEGG